MISWVLLFLFCGSFFVSLLIPSFKSMMFLFWSVCFLKGPVAGYRSVLRTFISAFIASYEISLQVNILTIFKVFKALFVYFFLIHPVLIAAGRQYP